MSAMYRVSYRTTSGAQGSIVVYAADAKTMARADLTAATRNAAKRARERLKTRGLHKVAILSINCVG